MNTTKGTYPFVFTLLFLIHASFALAQETQKPKYSADVPESILTPDKVETERLGTLNFFDGMPDEATVKKVYDNLDFSRGVEAFLSGMPAASMYMMCTGFEAYRTDKAPLPQLEPPTATSQPGCLYHIFAPASHPVALIASQPRPRHHRDCPNQRRAPRAGPDQADLTSRPTRPGPVRRLRVR